MLSLLLRATLTHMFVSNLNKLLVSKLNQVESYFRLSLGLYVGRIAALVILWIWIWFEGVAQWHMCWNLLLSMVILNNSRTFKRWALSCSFIGVFPSKGNGGSTLVLERRLLWKNVTGPSWVYLLLVISMWLCNDILHFEVLTRSELKSALYLKPLNPDSQYISFWIKYPALGTLWYQHKINWSEHHLCYLVFSLKSMLYWMIFLMFIFLTISPRF